MGIRSGIWHIQDAVEGDHGLNTATTYIAESIVKAVGVAGIEAMAMKNSIYSIWKPRAEALAEDIINTCFAGGEIREEYAAAVYTSHRTKMTSDFVEKASPFIEEYVGYAWDRGREDALGYALSGLLTSQKSLAKIYHNLQKDQESIIGDLVRLTGSTKANVQKTIKRWFEETQGQYFDRYIIPETARLLSYKEGASLRSIGERYKEFVKAEGYWSSISEFNSETSKVFAQVQTLHEMNVTTYTIEAIIDEKTCDVCMHLHGTTWSVEEALIKVYDMLIAEADEAYEMSPFPPRSTPKDFENPNDSPYSLPPYHPRCRCNIRSEHAVTAMPQEVLARPFDAGPKPTDKLLNRVYTQYVDTPTKQHVQEMVNAGQLPEGVRGLSGAEKKVAKEAWESIPLEIKKWASRNKENFQLLIEEGEEITSRVQGNRIFMNAKYFNPEKYGPQPLQHELRHALVNRSMVDARGGGNAIWHELSNAAADSKRGWRSPAHVNAMYQVNGNQGLRAATAASDEFLAMIGDHYKAGMSMDELIDSVRHGSYGISVSDELGSTLVSQSSRWSAKEARNACEYWWRTVDVDNHTLMSKKQILAKLNQKPNTAQIQAIAIQNEIDLRDVLRKAGIKKVYQEGDNAPFDVWVGTDPVKWYAGTSKVKPTDVIEVKTIVNNSNDKITMSKDALDRKHKELRKFGKKNTRAHTIVFDERNGKYYYRDDVGSFRLANMQEVTLDDLQRKFGGKPTGAVLEQVQEAPSHSVMGGAPAEYRVTYKPQTTVAKAQAEIKKKFGVDVEWGLSNDAKKMPYPAKVKTKILNQIGEELARLNNEGGVYKQWSVGYKKGTAHPNVKRLVIANGNDIDGVTLKYDKDLGYGKIFDQDGRGTSGTYIEDYYFGENTLLLAGSDVRKFRTDRVKNLNSVFLTRADLKFGDIGIGLDTMTTFDHELGHGVHYFLEKNDKKNFKKWKKIFDDHGKENWKKISVYAASDEWEGFAESFAAYMHPDYGVDYYLPAKVEKFFDDILGLRKTIREAPEYLDELAAAEARRTKIKGAPTVSLSKLKNMRPLEEGGINASYVAEVSLPPKVKGGPRQVKKVLYKPIEGESWVVSDLPPDELGLPSGWTFDALPDSMRSEWERLVGASPDRLVRESIYNLDTPLAYREMAALDVAKELKLKNIKFPKTHVVMEGGKPVGVAVEWSEGLIEDLKYLTKFASSYKPLTQDQKFEYTIFDYLIGNTDRHNRNILRSKRTGKTLAIDHGYSFPSQRAYANFGDDAYSLRPDGLEQFKSVPSRSMYSYVDGEYDAKEYARILNKLEKLDVAVIARRYNFSREETYAFEYRRKALVRLMEDERVGEYFGDYHRLYMGNWPEERLFGLENLHEGNVELWERVTEANTP